MRLETTQDKLKCRNRILPSQLAINGNAFAKAKCRADIQMETEMLNDDMVIEIAIRTDLEQQFLDQVHKVPGHYSVTPGRVWQSGGFFFRNYVVGSSNFGRGLNAIADHVRWHCTADGHVGLGLEA